MKVETLIIIILLIAIFLFFWMNRCGAQKEGISGFGVTSGLAYNNRTAYCQKGDGSWSGGCFIPHRVII